MGCTPSTLAVVELNRCLKTCDGPNVLQGKLQTSPWLLSAATPVLSSTGGTPLHTACERKQVEVVQQMLSFLSGASLTVVRVALQPYCRRCDRNLPGSVAEAVRLAVEMVNCKGQTPLMCACAAGSPELVKLLLAQGADPWVGDRCGCRTALHYAAISGSTPCIEALMQNMAVRDMAREGVRYINVRSTCGLAALHYAVFFDHPAAVEELLRHDPHLNAATSSHSYDVFVTCEPLSTPLHFAAVRGNVEGARQLLRHHVTRSRPGRSRDPRLLPNQDRQLPWQVAAAHHPTHRELVALLHPGRPLEEALGLSASVAPGGGEEGVAALGRLGPASLAALAAAALQTRLLGELGRLQRAGGDLGAGASGTTGAGCCVSGSAAAQGVPSGSTLEASATDVTEAEGRQGKEEGEEEAMCGVCLASRASVVTMGCGHGVCGGCAAQMARLALSGSRPRPLLCPFCRRAVSGFTAVDVRKGPGAC